VVKHGVNARRLLEPAGDGRGDASALYARNLLNFLASCRSQDRRAELDRSDEIIAGSLVCINVKS